MDENLIKEYKNEWSVFFKLFANFKSNQDQGRFRTWIRSNNEYVSIVVYFTIGLLPFIAFIWWVF